MKNKVVIELKPEQIFDNELIRKIAARYCHLSVNAITGIDYLKRSLDSRNKKPRYELIVEVYSGEPYPEKPVYKSKYMEVNEKKRVIIIGAGPAGYFAALELLEYGIKPIILERGKDVRSRRRDIRNIMQLGQVDPNSNYSFGEGGAGAYSDGKLYTRSDKRGNIKKVLQILVEHGANPDILIDAHPHIGSNKLPKIINQMRETIINHGGEIHFESLVTDIIIKEERAIGTIVNSEKEFFGNAVILATGHSARDIYYMLHEKNIYITAKPFAVGFRVEHSQELINNIQYGKPYNPELPPASYRLASQINDKGVFSFCMCPGGVIVPSVTDSNELVVNGMSNSGRNSRFANSGIVTSVDIKDFSQLENFGNLACLKYQEFLEKKFYTGNLDNPLKAPAQKLTDFVNKRQSSNLNDSSYIPGLINSELHNLFPKNIMQRLQLGVKSFGIKMKGFLTEEANVIGLESRTSSPIRIDRDRELFSHVQIKNLYPCGEGSGYAGGIVSSALDGQNCAKAITNNHFK